MVSILSKQPTTFCTSLQQRKGGKLSFVVFPLWSTISYHLFMQDRGNGFYMFAFVSFQNHTKGEASHVLLCFATHNMHIIIRESICLCIPCLHTLHITTFPLLAWTCYTLIALVTMSLTKYVLQCGIRSKLPRILGSYKCQTHKHNRPFMYQNNSTNFSVLACKF